MSEFHDLPFIHPRMWWLRGFYHIDNCCSDHMHMFYRSHVNIVVNPLRCLIISEIPQLIGDYIHSSWPVFSVSFLPSMSFFQQAKNFQVNNPIFTNVSGSVRSGKKDLKDYSYYQTTLSDVLTLQVLTCCMIIVLLLPLTTHMKPNHTNLVALKGLERSTSTTSLPGLLV